MGGRNALLASIFLCAVSGAAFIYGCGISERISEFPWIDKYPGEITSTTEGSKVAASGNQAASLVANTGQTITDITELAISVMNQYAPEMAPSPSRADTFLADRNRGYAPLRSAGTKGIGAARVVLSDAVEKGSLSLKPSGGTGESFATISETTTDCANGGTVATSGSYDGAASSFSVTITYSECKRYDERLTGSVTVSGTRSGGSYSLTVTLGDGSGTADTSDFTVELYTNNYRNVFATYYADISVEMSSPSGGTTFDYTINGQESYTDFMDVFTVAFSNLRYASRKAADGSAASISPAGTTRSGTDTVSGNFTQTWTVSDQTYSSGIAFSDFSVAWAEGSSGGSSFYTYAIDGETTLDFTPAPYCKEGAFVYETNTPVYVNTDNGKTTAGRITIDGNTVTTYGTDGALSLDFGGDTLSFSSMANMDGACAYGDYRQAYTIAEGSTGTVTGADTMLITSSWDTNSTDMDLHLNYYDVQDPAAETAGNWYVDWHGSSSCTSSRTGDTWDGIDISGNGKCDIGLDYDDVNGYGPEHITALTLPDGYYVVSVNSYSNAYDTAVTVSVVVGDILFLFNPHTFSGGTSDSEGTTSDAWYRVCDIRVNGDTVEVLAPDTSLQPWHDGVFGLSKPGGVGKLKKYQ